MKKVGSLAAGAALAVCASAGSAHAGYIQTLGIDENCAAVGGACEGLKGDLGSYDLNPAAATSFDRPRLGLNLRMIDTRNLDLIDSAGRHDISRTNTLGDTALAPTIAGYLPLTRRLTVGIGVGAPYAITAEWGGASGLHRYDMSDQSLFVLDVAPTIAYKVTDKLSVGATLSITALKQLRTQTLIPNSFGAALPPSLGGAGTVIPTTPTSPIIGSITLNTRNSMNIGLPPNAMESAFDEGALVLGAQYKLTPNITLGLSGRTLTKTTFHGTTTLVVGPTTQSVPFHLRLDMPAHVQVGIAAQVTPSLLLSADYQRTFWSNAVGLGAPAVVQFERPLLGFVNKLQLDYQARDTDTFRFGAQYKVMPPLTLLAGYARDGSVFPTSRVDILTYDSGRNIFSGGLRFDTRAGGQGKGWIFTGSFQWVQYDKRNIATGQSANLGGVSLPVLLNADTLSFGPNRGPYQFGGDIRAVSVEIQRAF